MHPRGLALLSLVTASACGRLSFDPAVIDARGDGLPSVDAFDVTTCHDTPGLVAYWPFDETSGTVAADYSKYGQDGQLMGAATWVPGRVGGALEFATDGTVHLQQTSGLTFGGGTGSFTFSYWLAPNSVTNNVDIRPFELAYCTGLSYLVAYVGSDGSANFSGYDSNGNYANVRSPAGALQIGTWTHLVFVLDRTNNLGQTYVNGVAAGVGDISSWVGTISCTNPATANIGGWSTFDYLGKIDDVRIYDRVLSQPEIDQLATMTMTRCP